MQRQSLKGHSVNNEILQGRLGLPSRRTRQLRVDGARDEQLKDRQPEVNPPLTGSGRGNGQPRGPRTARINSVQCCSSLARAMLVS